MDIFTVIISKSAEKSLNRVPVYVVEKLQGWVDDVEDRGLREVRKVPGYHDEPLHGKRQGQRSIRLSKGYRAIYVIHANGKVDIIKVIEVNKHDY